MDTHFMITLFFDIKYDKIKIALISSILLVFYYVLINFLGNIIVQIIPI